MTDAHKTELMLIRLSADLIKEMQAPAASSVALPDVQWPYRAAALWRPIDVCLSAAAPLAVP